MSTKKRKSSGVPKRDGRRVVPGDLVAPRALERVLHDRQQLDVGEAESARVRRERAARSRDKPSERLPSSGTRAHEPRWTS